MTFNNTLQDIKSFIDGLDTFPINRTTSVFYGKSNDKLDSYIAFSELVQIPEYSTCGVLMWKSNFNVHVFHTNNQNAISLASTFFDLFNNQNVTPNTSQCMMQSMAVIEEENHKFHVIMNYDLIEGT